MVGQRGTLLERFETKFIPEPNTGCWLWTGTLHRGGYGKMGRGRATDGVDYAHRISWELFRGPIPEGLSIDHLCRVRCCVNPDHLEPVTTAENIRRGETGAKPKAECLRGHPFDEHGYVTKTGAKRCRLCDRIRSNLNYARRRNVIEERKAV